MDQLSKRRERKEFLKKEIDRQRQLIQEEDFKLMKLDESGNPPDNHQEQYENKLIDLNKELNILKQELEDHRLLGDKFYVLHGEDSILIEIDESSVITFYHCEQSRELPMIPMEKCNGSRIQIIEDSDIDNPIYELHTILSTKPIHQLFSVKTNFESTLLNNNSKPSLFERVKQNTWSLGISPLRRTTSDPTIFGERFSPPKSISFFMEKYNTFKNSSKDLLGQNNNNQNIEVKEVEENMVENNGKILLTWNNKETSVYILKSHNESLELLELLGSHIDRLKKVTARQSQQIKLFNQQKQTSYDSNNAEHEGYLQEIWTLLYPDQEFQKKSPNWKQFGFQSEDPTRDFRGMGMLGLFNLTYLVRNHRDWVDSILKQDRDYPFAVAGINISNLLFEIFNITEESLQQPWYSSFWSSSFMAMLCAMSRESDHAFEELYFLVFKLMDHIWTEMNATYMQFPVVTKKLKSLLSEISQLSPNSFDEVRAKFDLIMISNIITPTPSPRNHLQTPNNQIV
ncbi:engulfment and cell motility ELM family protein [Tieghemostelium lacteum]|uniref:Engulfment and cell motility ELM family protein n=1 Tax=Tieghemostelium lacteum TaxID=361077 RepID=A0A151Z3B5_TIELA|nr:engulfment and cell motility ELM family protein [Tieghemostelium lacteum]|eukprot:KYQ88314.1 engulfment and cell motility ELM family protein [Tieghemostelium lacteum]